MINTPPACWSEQPSTYIGIGTSFPQACPRCGCLWRKHGNPSTLCLKSHLTSVGQSCYLPNVWPAGGCGHLAIIPAWWLAKPFLAFVCLKIQRSTQTRATQSTDVRKNPNSALSRKVTWGLTPCLKNAFLAPWSCPALVFVPCRHVDGNSGRPWADTVLSDWR